MPVTTYLAEVGGRVVGQIEGMSLPVAEDAPSLLWRRAVVTALSVNAAWRRRGVGRFLVERFQERVAARGPEWLAGCEGIVALAAVVIDVPSDALAPVILEAASDARAFFAALGFERGPGLEGTGMAVVERYRAWRR